VIATGSLFALTLEDFRANRKFDSDDQLCLVCKDSVEPTDLFRMPLDEFDVLGKRLATSGLMKEVSKDARSIQATAITRSCRVPIRHCKYQLTSP
jgi:hypothetical protein